ncbi:HlyD family secretion protein [Roseiconus nitratireducens]|uniref:HlyD family secretion protein n=1 Tax=Roseiconus nitratireducens TaxID=2605748 RepID=A0A5M6D869_9BACT|nr:efflux RND transporter periplasmic adaptor subunit [Roseiconus nitratireducens]KAA5542690.1 HlyD family secretion protein [Roseiconus nitratireducens]
MIVFLTLLYVAALMLVWKLGIIRMNLAWKLSPIVWFLVLLVGLFIPMQWGAPAGPVAVFRFVDEIVPAVSGQVTEVPVKPLTKLKRGDVLFQIDPAPFQYEVRRLEAALIDAKQQPELLASDVSIAEAALATAAAERERASGEFQRSEKLLPSNAVSQQEYDDDKRTAEVADRAYDEAEARLQQAKLKLDASTSSGVNTAVAQAEEQLAEAKYNLEQTTVRAPADGIVQQLALRPGTRVAAIPLSSKLVFIESDRQRISMAVNQNQLRYVKVGQPAEIVLKYLPGTTLQAKVLGIADVTSGGQVRSSGVIEDVSPKQEYPEPLQVVLEITDDRVSVEEIPGGAVGTAAIYTQKSQFTHLIRRVMMRMQTWLNYIL